MGARLSLICSLVLLGACNERVLGSPREMVVPEGGLDPSQEDNLLEQYALDLEGEWQATSPDRGATFTIEFTRSEQRRRSGTVNWEVQVDCMIAVPAFFPVPVRPCEIDRERPRFPEPETWEAEYWLLKLDGTDAVVTMLLDRSQAEGVSLTCLYVPKPAPAQLRCGVTFAGFPFGSTTFTRPSH